MSSARRDWSSCDRCGRKYEGYRDGSWWMHPPSAFLERYAYPPWELLCGLCTAIIRSDDGDWGDEHVESVEESETMHAGRWQHATRSCRVCVRAGGFRFQPGVLFSAS